MANYLDFHLVDPLGYFDFLTLQQRAGLVITDVGSIQEETTWLSVSCLTVRENIGRPVTIELGTNRLVGQDIAELRQVARILAAGLKTGQRPPL